MQWVKNNLLCEETIEPVKSVIHNLNPRARVLFSPTPYMEYISNFDEWTMNDYVDLENFINKFIFWVLIVEHVTHHKPSARCFYFTRLFNEREISSFLMTANVWDNRPSC